MSTQFDVLLGWRRVVVSESVLEDGSHALLSRMQRTSAAFPGDELLVLTNVVASVLRRSCAGTSHWRPDAETRKGLLSIWGVESLCRAWMPDGRTLPGDFRCRRAAALFEKLHARPDAGDPLDVMDWVNLYALAVNENAAGGRVVTAPTNGAAGISLPSCTTSRASYRPRAMTGWSTFVDRRGNRNSTRRTPQYPVLKWAARGGRRRVFDGGGRALCGVGWDARAGGERCRNRHGAPSWSYVRPGRRPRTDSVHRTKCGCLCQGHQCGSHGLHGDGVHHVSLDKGHQDHARDGRRYENQ